MFEKKNNADPIHWRIYAAQGGNYLYKLYVYNNINWKININRQRMTLGNDNAAEWMKILSYFIQK